MRALCLAVLAATVLACAGNPAPPPEPGPAVTATAGSVAHVNAETGMVVIRTASPYPPGELIRMEGEAGATAIIRVGSYRDGMLAGLVESGAPTEGPCILRPVRAD